MRTDKKWKFGAREKEGNHWLSHGLVFIDTYFKLLLATATIDQTTTSEIQNFKWAGTLVAASYLTLPYLNVPY